MDAVMAVASRVEPSWEGCGTCSPEPRRLVWGPRLPGRPEEPRLHIGNVRGWRGPCSWVFELDKSNGSKIYFGL